MELSGTIIAVLDARSGVSAKSGNSWKSQEYVIETSGEYPHKCVFNVFGEEKIAQFNIQRGDQITVQFDIDAREYSGRWYNDVRAYNVIRPNTRANYPKETPVEQSSCSSPIFPPEQADDDLPF